jgi:hypothetical protein
MKGFSVLENKTTLKKAGSKDCQIFKFFTFSPIGTALLANAGMFIYASIILQTLEKSRKYLVRTTTTSAKSARTTQYKQISRSLSSTSSNDSGPKLRQKQKPSIERYIFLANIIKVVTNKSSKLKTFPTMKLAFVQKVKSISLTTIIKTL